MSFNKKIRHPNVPENKRDKLAVIVVNYDWISERNSGFSYQKDWSEVSERPYFCNHR